MESIGKYTELYKKRAETCDEAINVEFYEESRHRRTCLQKLKQHPVPTSERREKMCYKVECSKCGKFTWNGCGKHVTAVYEGIEKGKHCECKSWPGVETKAEEGSTSTTKEGEAKA